jgi:TRAP-type C4-dicarboxylate transport system permease small subunit
MALIERMVHLLSRFCDRIAQVAVVAMMLLVVGNILGRKLWKPIYGTFDFVGFLGAILVAFALAYCALKKGHIEVELVMARLPERAQGIIGSITHMLSLAIFSLITWQCIVLGDDMRRSGELSMTALVPSYPYIYAVAFGCALLCVVILVDIIKSLVQAVKG